ncbi:MAG: dTDP-4-dehydrorhamnose reductase [Lautropia sp.]
MSLRILLTGATGQVGWELRRSLAPLGEILAPTRERLDLSRPETLGAAIDAIAPDLVVNPAAYTAVDRAETEVDAAMTVNRDAPAAIAAACRRRGIGLVHFSTDYVHPGDGDAPWTEDGRTGPLNVYGRSKLEGEEAIRASGCDALVFRTSWVYAARGGNFLLTMLRLGASGKPLSIVADQWGAPTPARLIASTVAIALAKSLEKGRVSHFGQTRMRLTTRGTFNLCAGGTTTWHGFATEIFRLREAMTGEPAPAITPTDSAAFKTAATRPANSRLSLERLRDTFGIVMPDWSVGLQTTMQDGPNPLATYLSTR